MMNSNPSDNFRDSVNQLLVFRVRETDFGVDTRQVSGIRDPLQINHEEIDLLELHKIIGFKSQEINYQSPKVLLIKLTNESKAIVVEAPDDIIFVQPSDIRPIPRLIEKLIGNHLIWGVFNKGDRNILILDFLALFKTN